ncbi:MAG: hypothetical protein WEE53_01295 [Acidimicrobiia bacterium]
MTEARDLTTDSHLEPDELLWLEERLVEYREMLEYLRMQSWTTMASTETGFSRLTTLFWQTC